MEHYHSYLLGVSAGFEMSKKMLEDAIAEGMSIVESESKKTVDPDIELAASIKRLKAKNLI